MFHVQYIQITKVVTFHVLPVNEYWPDVDAVPGIVISEGNVSLPYYLAGLLEYFKDRDCPKKHLMFSITKYSSSEVILCRHEGVVSEEVAALIYHGNRCLVSLDQVLQNLVSPLPVSTDTFKDVL